MLLSSMCTLDVACCGAHTTALEAACLMRRKHTGDLVVIDDGEDQASPLGVITDRDIVVEVLGNGLDPGTTTVASIIRTPVVIASETEDTSHALERMRHHGIRRLPVVSAGGKLVGIVTVDDLVKHLALEANALREIVSREQGHEQRTRR